MSQQEYESLRVKRPDLGLPAYQLLIRQDRKRLRTMNTPQLIVSRAQILLARLPGLSDRLQNRRKDKNK